MVSESELQAAHRKVLQADDAASAARRARDELIRAAAEGGMSGYRVAQLLGIGQTAVAKIRRSS